MLDKKPDKKEALPLNAIRAFVMIARESNVSRAALVLGITQSAVSRHLAVLESYLGAKLIERRGRNTTLTDFGRRFAEAVGEPLDAIALPSFHDSGSKALAPDDLTAKSCRSCSGAMIRTASSTRPSSRLMRRSARTARL